jgi:hypothetical protein
MAHRDHNLRSYGDIKKIMSDVIANYEDNKRNEYKSRGDNRNKGSFRLLPTELFYTYVNNRETLILHTFGETTKNLNSILTGDSYLFVYRTIDKKRNLDVLRIDNVDNHLRSIETFEVLKNDDVNKYRSWRMKRRQNKIRAAKSDRKKEYLENIQKTSSEIGYRMNINNDREFPWFI